MERKETFFNFAVSERAFQKKVPKCEGWWTVENTKGREVIKREEVSDEKSNKVGIAEESRRGKVTKVKSEQK